MAAALLTVPAHAAPFAVYGPTPTQTFVNAATEFTGTFESGDATIERCILSVDGTTHGTMTLTGTSLMGTAKRTTSINTAGSHTVRVTCYDDDGPSNIFHEETVTVFADSSVPTVSTFTLTPPAPVAGSAVTIQTNYDDTEFGSGMNTCGVIIDGVESGLMSLSGGAGSTVGTASLAVTVATAGSHSLMVNCFDRSGNMGTRTQNVSFTAPADTTNPVVSAISPSSATVGTAVNIQGTVSDNVGISSCSLEVNGVSQGGMTVASGIATKALSFTIVGDNAVKVTCLDAAGNSGFRSVLINVSAASSADATAPVVTSINPSSATAGSAVNVSASFSDSVGVTACNLYVNSSLVGSMERAGTTSGTATRSHVFASGTNVVEVRCNDAAGNNGTTSRTITASPAGTPSPYVRRLVKLRCPSGFVDPNHPCKAVYYVGSDGKRHAFPNERAYFTWYTNFDGVVELDSLASFELGVNATYRPGIKLVKFTTVDRVYAVGRGGVLRWITSESAARTLYGTNWNRQVDDLSDAFYTNYRFGADINSSSEFSPSSEAAAVTTVDANF